jgi:hypothetical protein
MGFSQTVPLCTADMHSIDMLEDYATLRLGLHLQHIPPPQEEDATDFTRLPGHVHRIQTSALSRWQVPVLLFRDRGGRRMSFRD